MALTIGLVTLRLPALSRPTAQRGATWIWPMAVVALMAVSFSAVAQQPPLGQPRAAPKQAATSTAPKSAAAEPAPSSGGEASALRQRVEQLEEQLVDMQVTVGTLESLARSGGSAGPATRPQPGLAPSGADETRVAALENQVRVLANMVEQMQLQQRQGRAAQPSVQAQPAVSQPQPPGPGGFQTEVTPNKDPIGAIIGQPGAAPPGPSMPQATASDGSAKDLYQTAYGLLLAQDYGAAEAAFDEFVRRFPNDALAGNAQYWLGETFYVRGNFKSSAAAFLKGYQTYPRSSKAPDSLLKLAMSLDRLGQRDAACQSFTELNTRYPNAPGAVRSRADTERRRLGCA